jgi:hypothetical protein
VRHRLQVASGGLVAFDVQEQTATLHGLSELEAHWMALTPFLALLEGDLASAGDALPELIDPPGLMIDPWMERCDPQRAIAGTVTL